MTEVLTIENLNKEDFNELILKGRLDAFGSRTLEDELKEQIKHGQYKIVLNFAEVAFLSSAGIRVLIKFYKELKEVGGFLNFTALPDKINHVVELAGLKHLFEDQQHNETERFQTDEFENESGIFKVLGRGNDRMSLEIQGQALSKSSASYSKNDVSNIEFSGDTYALGLGAIGDDFEDCKSRMGEYLAVGNTAMYMPTDGTKSVDYMQKSNQLVPRVQSLNSLIFKGQFGTFLSFETKEGHSSISLSEIAKSLFESQDAEALGLVMIAETTGLCGCFLNVSPFENNLENITAFPSVKENMTITTEPEFEDHLSITTAIIHKDKEELNPFTRPISTESELKGHFHSVALDFKPIQKDNDDLEKTIGDLLETSRLKGLLHLLNDERPHNGIGESGFKRGVCWLGVINEFKTREG